MFVLHAKKMRMGNNVMEMWKFQSYSQHVRLTTYSRQARLPSTDHQKICHRWLRRRLLRLCQIRCISVRGRLLGTWVKYNQNNFYLYHFFGNSPTGQMRRRIFTRDDSNDADSRKDVPFWGVFVYIAPHLGVKNPKKNNFGAWIGVFKPNSRNRKTCIL